MSEQRYAPFDDRLLLDIKIGRNDEAKAALTPELARASNDSVGTLLHCAAMWANDDVVARELVKLGAEIDCLGQGGKTALMKAVEFQRAAMVEFLLEAGANIDMVDAEGQNCLKMALDLCMVKTRIPTAFLCKLKTQTNTIQELAERLIGADGNMLHAAAFKDINLMKCMLNLGIDVNSKDQSGRTALHAAAKLSDLKLAEWLIDNGANVDTLDSRGSSALLIAARNRSKDTMKFLLEKGADVNCKIGNTLFELFASPLAGEYKRDIPECVELLLQYNAVPVDCTQTMFDFGLYKSVKSIKMVIAHLAMLEMFGTSITESVMYSRDPYNRSNMLELEKYYQQCIKILKITVFGKLALFDLLQVNEYRMKLLTRNKNFISEVRKVYSEHKFSEPFIYHSKTLKERINKASHMVKLEDEAITVMCKIFDGNYNQCYGFSRKVVSYLCELDLEQLIQV